MEEFKVALSGKYVGAC